MTARTFKYANRLAKALVQRSGMNLKEAVAAAEVQLEVLREPTLEELDRTVHEIAAAAPAIDRLDDPRVDDVYVAANRIIAMAGIFGRDELGEAAYSLCELITRLRASGKWSSAMVAVHVEALQVMRRPQDHTPEHTRALRDGLRKIVSAVA
ncbi:cheE protein [Phenylobacterium zucineum HLK1]|uniref:CheE protein n=1 Tax=Phenylobacterium zucineum (strain HLK1) TaxID=450851 RepID=B4RBD5_PHEZH|nr:hypothetical protein [Phenylobacterium zucineum]ACG79780.1 cheE protein [Phenylobacterium zucineum HLK1]